MTISRRQLYAAGEAFGECCTRREAGRIVCGGGDSSSSSDTTNIDRRNAVGAGGIGTSGDWNKITITDGGIASRALDSVDRSNALTGSSFDKLLDSADKLFSRSEALIGQTQTHVADAYRTANTDAKGSIDNKTILVLGVAAAVVAGAVAWKR